jgi:hypothetical protein
VREIWAQLLGRYVKLGGCKLPDKHAPTLKLGDYLDKAKLAPMPATCDWSAPAMSVISDIEGNASVGDCVLAEEAHFIGVVTGNATPLYSYTTAQTLAAYSAITGYDPNNPASDQGTDPLVCLNYFTHNKYADGSILAGYALVDNTNVEEVKFAINGLGNLKMWCGLPNAWVNPMPSFNGVVWDVAPANPSQGHCFGSPSYNSLRVVGANEQGVQVMTWGLVLTVTWAAVTSPLFSPNGGGGLAVRVTTDWIDKKSGIAPSGFAYADIINDFNTMFGQAIPIPGPPKPPLPTPAPVGTVVTVDMAKAWAEAGLRQGDPLMPTVDAIAAANAGLQAGWPQ